MSEERKVVEYKLVAKISAEDLSNEINELLSSGWYLEGGAIISKSASYSNFSTSYGQAMVRYEGTPKQ